MKILFSIYKDDKVTYTPKLLFSKWVYTQLSCKQIEQYLGLTFLFRYNLIRGQHLSFFDIYCYGEIYDELIDKIIHLPECLPEDNPITYHTLFTVESNNPGNRDYLSLPTTDDYALLNASKYDCGASGFSLVVYNTINNPISMIFVGGLIWDIFKSIICFLFKKVHLKRPKLTYKHYMFFSEKKFYKCFSERTKLPIKDCQIISFERLKVGTYLVFARTSENEIYKAICSAFGNIKSLELEHTPSSNELQSSACALDCNSSIDFLDNALHSVSLNFDVHAYAEEQLHDEYFERGDCIHGSKIIQALLKLRTTTLNIEFTSETTVDDVFSEITSSLDVDPDFLKSGLIIISFLIDGERHYIKDGNSLFLPIAKKYFDFPNTNVVNVCLLLNCNAGAVCEEDGLRYFMRSHEGDRHREAHVHVRDTGFEYEASLALADGRVLAGHLPRKLEKKAQQKIKNEKEYFYECWIKYTDGLIPDINQHLNLINY